MVDAPGLPLRSVYMIATLETLRLVVLTRIEPVKDMLLPPSMTLS